VLTCVPGVDRALYTGEEVVLSEQQTVLYATTRYTEHPAVPGEASSYPSTGFERNAVRLSTTDAQQKQPKSSKMVKTPQPGYITAILLTPYAEVRTPRQGRLVQSGFPIRMLFQQETTTTGGLANSISPADWGDKYFALADSQYGMVEVSAPEASLIEANNRRYGSWTTLKRSTIREISPRVRRRRQWAVGLASPGREMGS
jgi:hypothetical protein